MFGVWRPRHVFLPLAKVCSKGTTLVKVYSISDNFPVVIMLEGGYNLKEYVKGGLAK